MYERIVAITNEAGLRARPAAAFVACASKFKSDIIVKQLDEYGEELKRCPAKSIVFLLSMGLAQGSTIEIAAMGDDEHDAVDALVELVESGFGGIV
jgi:phosphocarrier protein